MSMNQDLQATHKIISLFETAKISLENIIDQLPDFFVVVDGAAEVLKGNNISAAIYKTDIETVLLEKMPKLFRAETYKIFHTYFSQVVANEKLAVEFELPMDHPNNEER